MKAPTQRGCKNLPLDADVLYMTMALIDYTLSPDIIRKWLNQVHRFLRSENKAQKEFEETVRQVQKKAMEAEGADYDIDEEAPIGGRIMPYEFLYLLCNAEPRMDALASKRPPKASVIKEKLSDFFEGEERRPDLEWLYPFDTAGNSVRHNAREQLLAQYAAEAKGTTVRIDDMRNLFKEHQKNGNPSLLIRDTKALMKREQLEAQRKAQQAEKLA